MLQLLLDYIFPCGRAGKYLIYDAPTDCCKWCDVLAWVFKRVFNLDEVSSFAGVRDCCDNYSECLGKKTSRKRRFSELIYFRYILPSFGKEYAQWLRDRDALKKLKVLLRNLRYLKKEIDRKKRAEDRRLKNRPDWSKLEKKGGEASKG